MKDNALGFLGSFTTIFAAMGITTETIQIIYYVLGVIGLLLTITSTIISWYKQAKSDGKIDADEVKDIVDKVNDEITDFTDKEKKD